MPHVLTATLFFIHEKKYGDKNGGEVNNVLAAVCEQYPFTANTEN